MRFRQLKGYSRVLLIICAAALIALLVCPALAHGKKVDRTAFSLVAADFFKNASEVAEGVFSFLKPEGIMMRIPINPVEFEPNNDDDDPYHFNWTAFYPETLFHGSGPEGIGRLKEMGIEPVPLFAYNMPWLGRGGRVIDPPTDNEEYGEFVVAVLHTIERAAPGTIKYIEIWNEPAANGLYWSGTDQEFIDFFRVVLQRVKEEFPHILVGGPSTLGSGSALFRQFVEQLGTEVDYLITHLYNDPAEMLMGKLDGLVDYARRVTGRDDLRMMLTEADHFQIAGAEKRHYLFERQFGLLERADILLGFHHFCLPYFTEGDRTFGLIHRDGAVLDYNYWPYWLMRDLRGTFLPVEVAANQRDITVGPLAAAADVENVVTRTDRLWITVAQDGDVVNAVVYNHGSTSEAVDVTLPVPFAGEGMAIISTVGPVGPGKVEAVPFASETGTFQVSLAVNARNGRAVTLLPLAEATEVWLEMELSKASVLVGQPVEVTVRIVNTSGVEQSGTAFVVGAPTDWPMELLVESNRFTELKPGEVAEFLWRMTPTSASYDEPFALYGFAQHRSPGTRSARAHSIPVHFSSQAPVRFDVLPNLIYVTPGAGGTLEITVQNTFPDQVTGELVVHVPEEDWGQLVETVYSLDVGETKVYEVELVVSEDAEEGSYPLQIDFIYNGVPFSSTVELVVKEFAVGREGTVVYLSGYFDADGFSSEDDFDDLLNFGGPFSLPAAFAPKPGRVEYLGRPFLFPNVADGELNMVRALGQTIPLPEGSYSEMAFLATAVNNSWRGPLVVTYADGSQENLELAVTDWCQEPRWGEIPVYRAPYRHAFGGRLYDAKPQIFLVTLPLNPDLEVTSITLPYLPELLVVALTLMR